MLRRQALVSEKLNSMQRQIYSSAVQDQLLNKLLVHKGSEFREMKNFKVDFEKTRPRL